MRTASHRPRSRGRSTPSMRIRWRDALLAPLATLAIKEDQAIFLAIAGAIGAWRFAARGARVALPSAFVAGHRVASSRHSAGMRRTAHWPPDALLRLDGGRRRALLFGGIAARARLSRAGLRAALFLPFRSRAMWLAAAPLAEVLALAHAHDVHASARTTPAPGSAIVFVAFAVGVAALASRGRARTALYRCARALRRSNCSLPTRCIPD